MSLIAVLYDGWSLARQPNSPAALHLVELFAMMPDDVRGIVALPEESFDPLPEKIEVHLLTMPDTPAGWLKWEQRVLPGLAKKLDAQILHLTAGHPPLFTSTPCLISPAGFAHNPFEVGEYLLHRSLAARLRESLGQGARARVSGILWPDDLAVPANKLPLVRLPPVIHPAFRSDRSGSKDDISDLNLPENYLLYHGPYMQQDVRRLLDAWAWVTGAIGESYPLLLVGMNEAERENLKTLWTIYQPGEMVRPLPILPHSGLVGLYQHCTALFHPAPISPWGSPVRLALACEKPVVSLESPLSDALVGPAAYLVPNSHSEADVSRALGAALLTVIVEDSVANKLAQAARQQVARWNSADFPDALLAAYKRFT